ncbi:hypothetical protein Tco_0622518 [Tanacetum coccineum]
MAAFDTRGRKQLLLKMAKERNGKAMSSSTQRTYNETICPEPKFQVLPFTDANHSSVPEVPLPPVVLMDSQEGGKGSFIWNHQPLWQIRSWRLYTLSNVHVLETISGEVLYMFADVSYPLSMKLMERILKHKLEIDKDVVGNDMTTAEQLIRFIKNQIAAAQVSPV